MKNKSYNCYGFVQISRFSDNHRRLVATHLMCSCVCTHHSLSLSFFFGFFLGFFILSLFIICTIHNQKVLRLLHTEDDTPIDTSSLENCNAVKVECIQYLSRARFTAKNERTKTIEKLRDQPAASQPFNVSQSLCV